MAMRPSIARQGIALTLVPELVQVAIVAALALALFQEQQAGALENASRNVLLNMSLFDKESADAITATLLCAESRGLIGADLAERALERLNKQINSIEASVAGNSGQRKTALRLRTGTERVIESCQNLLAQAGPTLTSHALRDAEREILRACAEAAPLSRDIADAEDASLAALVQTRENWRVAVRAGLIVALVSSIVTALLVGRRQFTHMVRKIQTLAQNAARLSRREVLPPSIPGNDELAFLDSVLHDVDEQLTRAMTQERDSFNNASQSIFVLDDQLRFRKANQACANTMGEDQAKLVQQSLVSHLTPDQRERSESLIKAEMKENGNASFETALSTRSGNYIPVILSACWSERERSFYCTAIDISERKRIEELKERFHLMLQERLTKPLRHVKSFTDDMLAAESLPAAARLEFQSIERNLTRVITLAESLDNWRAAASAAAALKAAPVEIDAVVAAACESVAALSGAKAISIVSQASGVKVKGDKDQLVRVVTNLLSNALKFSPAGASVEIVIEAREYDRTARIAVKDSDPGVPPEYRHHIFQPFGQAPNQSRSSGIAGVGLGLSICASIVEAHGGTYGVESTEGTGATFWFTLPLAGETSASS